MISFLLGQVLVHCADRWTILQSEYNLPHRSVGYHQPLTRQLAHTQFELIQVLDSSIMICTRAISILLGFLDDTSSTSGGCVKLQH